MSSFKPAFSLSSFTFIKRLLNSSSLFATRVVLSAYVRLLVFLLEILLLVCASSSPALLMMYSASLETSRGRSGACHRYSGKRTCLPSRKCRRHGFDSGLGVGNGNPLQYSCLENSTDGGARQATVHGVTKSWTWLSMHAGKGMNASFKETTASIHFDLLMALIKAKKGINLLGGILNLIIEGKLSCL